MNSNQREAAAHTDHEIEQILGRALGYPRYADDQKNFPDAADAEGVCVGEHTTICKAMAVLDADVSIHALPHRKGEHFGRCGTRTNALKRDSSASSISQSRPIFSALIAPRRISWRTRFGEIFRYSAALLEVNCIMATYYVCGILSAICRLQNGSFYGILSLALEGNRASDQPSDSL
jgi:hypothetical protein